MKEYYTVASETENILIIKHSKFICYIKSVDGEEDAKNFIESVKKKNSLANHNCYAYIADDKGLIQKFSDDGEPQGTAGMPMLEVLKNKRYFKTVAVVTRYFGGILLGAGGLLRAYSNSVAECIEKAKSLNMVYSVNYEIKLDYTVYSKIVGFLNNDYIKTLNSDFSNGVIINVAVKEDMSDAFLSKITDITLGTAQIKESGRKYQGF